MQTQSTKQGELLDLKTGDLVEVLSEEEILATLDEQGELDALPFMPEMLQYCGKRFRVYKSAHKTCDTMQRSGMRKMEGAVHLVGLRCDGGGHGGCQAGCLLFWKTAWLSKVEQGAENPATDPAPVVAAPAESRLLPLVVRNAQGPAFEDGTERFRCQATELLRAAPEVLPLLELGQFGQDVRTGNFGVSWTARAIGVGVYNRFQRASNKSLPRWARIRGGKEWGYLRGKAQGKTPTGRAGIEVGDLVRVRSREEIEPTLNENLLNRGMGFDAEMARFCGKTARVLRKVDQIIDENTGKMIYMKSPCLVLENVVCEGAFNANCPRAITPYWREIWLEKIEDGNGGEPKIPLQSTAG
ncbi:hypothetical protein [Dactylosporangium sp. NPDC051541]|uniref:hypothetical protein n=1 Tax=Dactylosporangium sp. NPDC051541 TaxID=3363977 RepID=UPI0037A843E3